MKYLPPLLNYESFVLYILLRILNRTHKKILYNLIVTKDDENSIYIYIYTWTLTVDIYHRVYFVGARTADSSGAPEYTSGF